MEISSEAQPAIPLPLSAIATFCRQWRVAELYIFGSILRGDFRDDSDVDFLYVLAPGTNWRFGDLLRAENELSAAIGRHVDLVSKKSIDRDTNWLRRKNILAEARRIYVAK